MPSKAPRIAGRALALARIAAETPGTDAAIREFLRRALGIDLLARLPSEWRAEPRPDARPLRAREPRPRPSTLPPPRPEGWPPVAASYALAYAARKTTPRRVAERALGELERLGERRPTMNVLAAASPARTLDDADAAAARYAAASSRGPLDGVPFLVKDEFDVAGLPTRLGSRCEPDRPAARDATIVERLRAAGAIFVGKTVLTEWGMSPIGANANARMPHNAFNPTRAPGGSSTGSAVGVALGIAPLAAGGDGGGSIRIPASLNGVFGIKPTFGRVSRTGDVFSGSVAHAGPIASSTTDLALFLDAVASERDPDDPLTDWAPPPPAGGFGSQLGAGVRGLRIGVIEAEWRDADPPVARACHEALKSLERDGAALVALEAPLCAHAARIGYVTLGPESLAAHRAHWLDRRELIGDDVRMAFAIVASFSALEHLDGQRLRAGLRRDVGALLRDVDVLAFPTTAMTAPRFTEDDARTSFSDPSAMERLCRFSFLGNLTGLPAATAPVGVDGDGLPIGLQIVGDAWDEATVLSVLAHLERSRAAVALRPPGAVELLG